MHFLTLKTSSGFLVQLHKATFIFQVPPHYCITSQQHLFLTAKGQDNWPGRGLLSVHFVITPSLEKKKKNPLIARKIRGKGEVPAIKLNSSMLCSKAQPILGIRCKIVGNHWKISVCEVVHTASCGQAFNPEWKRHKFLPVSWVVQDENSHI